MDSSSAAQIEPLLRVEEVARRLTISRAKAYEIIGRNELRSITIGTCRRVRPVDLEAYIAGLAAANRP